MRFCSIALVLLAVAAGFAKLYRSGEPSVEDRAYWEATGRKVTEGWEKGCTAGSGLGASRRQTGQDSMSSRELAKMAETTMQSLGINDPVIGSSFKRGFVFGFYQARDRYEGSGDQ